MIRFIFRTAFVWGLLINSVAFADAISMPDSCPEASASVWCHGPPTCQILGCTGDGDCTGGRVCAPRDLCIVERCCGRDCGTRYDHVAGPCGDGGACRGTTCQMRRVCVLPSAPTDAGTDSGLAGVDSGPADSDSGPADSDSGPADTDSGPADTDSGPASTDAGGDTIDSGSAVDAGGSGSAGGCGCRSVGRTRAPLGSWLAVLGMLLLGARHRRRR